MEARKPDPTRARYDDLSKPPGARRQARVAKLADALDLGSSAARRAGSTPASRIEIRPGRERAGAAAHLISRRQPADGEPRRPRRTAPGGRA